MKLGHATAETVGAAEAEELALSVLRRSRVSERNAQAVARALVEAELDGLGSHGFGRLLAYCDQALAEKVDGFATPVVTRPRPGVVHVDAANGFAFPAIADGLDAATEAGSQAGLVAVAVKRSHHCGVAGHHVERAARRGFVALMFANSPAAMAPWGGSRPSMGTNPIAFAAPRQPDPLIVDLSLSKVARGKIMVAGQRGEAIPEGLAFDREGRPTTDAAAALDGTMAPIGDAKGAALALMVEILAATLTGANHAFESSSFFDDKGQPPGVGQLILLFDPGAFGSAFPERLEVLLAQILGQPGVRLPGSRRYALRHKHLTEGFEVPADIMAGIKARLG